MAIDAQDPEFRHPEAVAFLRSLTDEQAAKQPPLVLEHDGVAARYWREGGRVRCREVEASVGPSSGTGALHAFMRAVEAEFGRSLPRLEAELRGGGVPDLDALEASIRDGLPDCGNGALRGASGGARRRASVSSLPGLRAADGAAQPGREDLPGAHGSGPDRAELLLLPRVRDRLPPAGPHAGSGGPDGHARGGEPLRGRRQFRQLRAGAPQAPESRRRGCSEDDAPAPCGGARRGDAGVRAGGRRGAACGGAGSAGDRRRRSPDGRPRGRGGVAGKQADGAAKTREAKAVVCREADRPDPKAGKPRNDRKSGAVSVRIDSAQAVNGAGRASEFAARLEQFAHRNGVFAAEEVVVLSDGAPRIRTVCEEILPGRKTTFILDLCRALEYASAAVQAAAPDKGRREAWMDWIRKQLDAGRVDRAVAALKRHRRLEAVAACIRYCEANMDRMRCDLCRRRGLPVGSGIVESACKRIVGSRLKGAGRRWSKAGANAVLATGCCLENRRWPDFLEWRACRLAAA